MITKTTVKYYITKNGDNLVKDFINSLGFRQRAKVFRIFFYVEEYGLTSILPYVKKLTRTPLWEIRILGKDNIRILYVVPERTTVLALHGFIKKSQKTPAKEIEITLNRYNDWLNR